MLSVESSPANRQPAEFDATMFEFGGEAAIVEAAPPSLRGSD
jgi:hypothetical protein